MEVFLIGVVALAAGVAVGAGIVLRRREGLEPSLALEGWLSAHAAELRRLGDSAASRDGEQERLRSEVQAAPDGAARDVERIVAARAREVAAYLDPSVTAPVAVAAIPDAAYGALRRAHADAFLRGVVLVPYSCALPVVLFLYSLVSRYGQ